MSLDKNEVDFLGNLCSACKRTGYIHKSNGILASLSTGHDINVASLPFCSGLELLELQAEGVGENKWFMIHEDSRNLKGMHEFFPETSFILFSPT